MFILKHFKNREDWKMACQRENDNQFHVSYSTNTETKLSKNQGAPVAAAALR